MKQQTLQPDEWIVADGGSVPVRCTMGQIHVRETENVPPGAINFIRNLRRGVWVARGKCIVVMEDDDYYHPQFLRETYLRLQSRWLVGGVWQPYYHIGERVWKLFRNRGSSMCQTGFRRGLVPFLMEALNECESKGSYGVDGTFWSIAARSNTPRDEYDAKWVIGMKGLPGQPGLGVGHRLSGSGWQDDPDWAKLREWIGEPNWRVYAELSTSREEKTETPTGTQRDGSRTEVAI